MAASKVRLKLLIDKKGCKVLFAEAGKDFVEFLFYLLSLPAGTIVKLLREKYMVGCLSSLYQSIETLSETSMQQNRHKNSVLNPRSPFDFSEIPFLLSRQESNTRKFYSCPNIADVLNLVSPGFNATMSCELSYISPVVMPMSTICSLTLLNKFNVKDVGGLEEKVVDGLRLLKASLECKTVLTSVFLGN
ncbi:hypothetical protein CISIN_1g042483mg [Citrus sinensis]|uniref:DUF674 domain-containing protein n=1 Tax=Citrus sinensis TaxID=2711 RepID=A0A067FWF5_CITSI|nr:hypothetical protein CISIN_1g042483mg [Citrus sinensis]